MKGFGKPTYRAIIKKKIISKGTEAVPTELMSYEPDSIQLLIERQQEKKTSL